MILNFPIELVAEHNNVLAAARQELLIGISGIPNPRFRHEVETRAVNHTRTFPLTIGSEEYRCSKDSLKRGDQAPVLGAALLHAEGVEHGSGTFESNLR